MGFKSVLGTIAPFLGAAATGNVPALVTMAAAKIGTAFGVKVDPTPQGIEKAVTDAQAADPEALLKLKSLDIEFQETMAKLGIDSVETLEKIAADDRDSARKREIAVKDKTPMVLSVFDGAGFVAAFVVLLCVAVPPAIHDLLVIMVTTLANNLVQERSYYFGSSSGSAAKTQIMAQQAASKD